MDNIIDVPVTYKSKNLIFSAHFLQIGYSYKFEVEVNGEMYFFEQDEEQNYRALVAPEISSIINIEGELLKLIAESIKNILK